ncbi:hypothetical protein GALMADRAFT_1128845 [Galerina marginata CBS 339.88]|uniref:Uncharacterized protein n=1 Tax=Galerina marginata (strain CBS 339.88) TaxID=685588 RepID=A0A067SK07_GALM3|nr:hypothetical protein GALMADRAFT_1128845 [Galerina marginata CBS 339.88]
MASSKAAEGDGHDPEPGQSHDSSGSLSRVLVTATDSDLVDHRIVVPLLQSYEETLVLAIELLGAHFDGKPAPEEFSLQISYALKSAAGKIVWAGILPRLWTQSVANGDDLLLVKKGFEFRPPQFPMTDLVVFEYKHPANNWTKFCGVAPAPRSYKDAQNSALTVVKSSMQNKNPTIVDFKLRVVVDDGDGSLHASKLCCIKDTDWVDFLALVKKEQSRIVFRVTETKVSLLLWSN